MVPSVGVGAPCHDSGISHKVIFTGWRDLPRIYADLNALVISSDNEGTPVSAIEQWLQSPVVGTKVGGVPDLITDGETGYLVPPEILKNWQAPFCV
jgi:glycosyltransferase involved in cell wall biosynthesis